MHRLWQTLYGWRVRWPFQACGKIDGERLLRKPRHSQAGGIRCETDVERCRCESAEAAARANAAFCGGVVVIMVWMLMLMLVLVLAFR